MRQRGRVDKSETTVFEIRLERSELVEPARGIIRVTDETSDTKREHVVKDAGGN